MASQNRERSHQGAPESTQIILQIYESEAFSMLTVLFIAAILFGAYSLLSVIERQSSREVGSYLRYEYNTTLLSSL